MTDKEKILAEIERLKKEAFNKINHNGKRDMVTDVANSQRIAICEQLLDFINTLHRTIERLKNQIKASECTNGHAYHDLIDTIPTRE